MSFYERMSSLGRGCAILISAVLVALYGGDGTADSAPLFGLPKAEGNAGSGNDEGDGRLRYKRALPTAEVIIDAGHGGIDGGAHFGDVMEKDINLAIAKKVYLLLGASGIRPVLNRTGDYALSDDNRWHQSPSRHKRDLSQRSQLTKEIETRLLISLHVNWSGRPDPRGPLVLHQNEGQSALLAFCIQDTLNRQQHTRFLPKVGKPYFLLNVVKQPAVIVEMGYLSNGGDRNMLTDARKQLEVAAAITSGIRNYLLIR